MTYDVLFATDNDRLADRLKTPKRVGRKIRMNRVTNTDKFINFLRKRYVKHLSVFIDPASRKINIERLIYYLYVHKDKLPKREMDIFILINAKHKTQNLVQLKELIKNLTIQGILNQPSNKEEAGNFWEYFSTILQEDDHKKQFENVKYLEKENVFSCTFKNGEIYFLPRKNIAGDNNRQIKRIVISKDRYAFKVILDGGEFYIPWDYVLHECEDKYEHREDASANRLSPSDIGKRIKEIRMKLGIKQVELEKRTGINRENIYRLENGKHHPNIDTLEKIADALNIPIYEILAAK